MARRSLSNESEAAIPHGPGKEASRSQALPRHGLKRPIPMPAQAEGRRQPGALGGRPIPTLQTILVLPLGAEVELPIRTQTAARHLDGHLPQRHLLGVEAEHPIHMQMVVEADGARARGPRLQHTSLRRPAAGARALLGKVVQAGMWYVNSLGLRFAKMVSFLELVNTLPGSHTFKRPDARCGMG